MLADPNPIVSHGRALTPAANAIAVGALISSVAGVVLGTSGSPRILLTLLLASASLALVAAAADPVTAPTRSAGGA
jgi:ABC-type transport system involved in cytochrome c biogenesis permease component